MSSEGISERDFERAADDTLRLLERALDGVDGLEVDLQMGVLTVEFGDGTKYVINSHRAARQIWMAAERTAWHFDPREGGARWQASKDGAELWTTVEGVLSRKLGSPVELPR
ncbi:iron donor protein CyaY [Polyangium spumosum]|uniref:Iron donor protein CyaY n=1 Tax=Polyangium spumosum TaxID=889282 RepID=A0A6N7PT71_9BACT|nr:iron donor protein CyaY [Polyangium spumosum]MRG93610.1 iron donor protein CyaY [Polyangium spumosum]